MKKVKMTAMAMAVAMMMSLCCPVYAAAPTGADTETKTVRVTNVDGAATVKAYRIVEPIFSGNPAKFGGYQKVAGVSIADIERPTSAEITTIAKAIKSGSMTISEAWVYDGTDYSTEQDAKNAVDTANVITKHGDKWAYNGTDYDTKEEAYNAAITHRAAASSLTEETMEFTGDEKWYYNGTAYNSESAAQTAAVEDVAEKWFYKGDSYDTEILAQEAANLDITLENGNQYIYGGNVYTTLDEAKDAAYRNITHKWIYNGTQYDLAIAAQTAALSNISHSKGEATANLGAGVWIVLVTDNNNAEYVYNPMVVSVQYDDAAELGENNANMSANGVDATGRYDIGQDGLYAKRSTIPFDLSIASPDSAYANDHGSADDPALAGSDDLQAGDTGHYQILTQIPEYSDAYSGARVTYQIETILPDGFNNPTNMKIYVKNGNDFVEIEKGENTATATPKTSSPNDFDVVFAPAYAVANAGKEVKVTFDSVLNDSATTGLSGNDITSTLTFTNDLDGNTTAKNDSVHEYSFALDSEILKVEKDINSGDLKPFANAVFTLTKVSPSNDASHVAPTTTTYTTGANGKVVFTHLDEGTYKVQETSAPDGYAVNSTEYTVTITPTYTGTGSQSSLQKYAVTVAYTDANGAAQSSTYEYDGVLTNQGQAGGEALITVDQQTGVVDESATSSVKVINIKLAQLPATGRNGTILFSVIGSAIMAAAVIIILKKRKELVD